MTEILGWLFGKKESPAAKRAKENSKACERALDIVRKCDSIGDNEIRELVQILRPVNPDIDEAWFRKIVGMGNMAYLSYAQRSMSGGQRPSDQKKFVKDTLENQLAQVRAIWDKMAREL